MLGRDLVERKAKEKWEKRIVEQVSLDLNSLKLQQVGAEINEKQKLQQAIAELGFSNYVWLRSIGRNGRHTEGSQHRAEGTGKIDDN
jgi:hypothetical protein